MTANPPPRVPLPERRKSGILEDPTQTPTSVNAMSAVFHKPEHPAEPATFKPKNNPGFILHEKLKTSYEEVCICSLKSRLVGRGDLGRGVRLGRGTQRGRMRIVAGGAASVGGWRRLVAGYKDLGDASAWWRPIRRSAPV
jgi:hypothetical protein